MLFLIARIWRVLSARLMRNGEWMPIRKMIHLAESVAAGMGGSCEINIVKGYPVLYNNPELTSRTRKTC